MAFLDKKDLDTIYTQSKQEAHQWKEDYPSFERLMDNGLMAGLDPNLPEVNDGSLSAALFKLPKRIVSSSLSGTVKSIDRDEAWLSELANLQWQNEIVPNANTQAPFLRKWKDAVRKAAGYGSVPLITIFVEKDGKRHSDFIVAQPQDVVLEMGKVSDYDADVIFWDVYYTKLQLENMIEEAKAEKKDSKKDNDADEYNKWDIPALQKILDSDDQEERSSMDTPRKEQNKNVRPKGFKFCIAFQRGVDAPFYMYHSATDSTVREWSNPDPTGDIPVHYMYCYQDFINPYGIGIVKLAGGTQNVLDYMRQADVLATQLGLRPPINIQGDTNDLDIDSLVYAQDALWFTGNAVVKREELANGVYEQLPSRIQMYKTSLNQIIPTGDTSSTAAESGDPTQSKTPAGVKLQAANLSIDDEDFKDNLYVTYAAVARSMINTQFANMEGTDLMKLSDDEREILQKAGMDFPENSDGEISNQVEIEWDTVRSKFDFEVDPEVDKTKDDADKLEGLQKVAELAATDPTFDQDLAAVNKKFNKGELYADMVGLTTDNDKIITDVGPEDEKGTVDPTTGQPMTAPAQAGDQAPPPKTIGESISWKAGDLTLNERAQALAQGGIQADAQPTPTPNDLQAQAELQQKQQQLDQSAQGQQHSQSMDAFNAVQSANQPEPAEATQPETSKKPKQPTPEEMQANVQAVMQQYGVDENTALAALAAEHAGLPPEDVINHLKSGAKV